MTKLDELSSGETSAVVTPAEAGGTAACLGIRLSKGWGDLTTLKSLWLLLAVMEAAMELLRPESRTTGNDVTTSPHLLEPAICSVCRILRRGAAGLLGAGLREDTAVPAPITV